jgi:hypothetical protein
MKSIGLGNWRLAGPDWLASLGDWQQKDEPQLTSHRLAADIRSKASVSVLTLGSELDI